MQGEADFWVGIASTSQRLWGFVAIWGNAKKSDNYNLTSKFGLIRISEDCLHEENPTLPDQNVRVGSD